MGCLVCLELTSQLSPTNDFTTGISYDSPYDHMDHDELSTTLTLKLLYLRPLGEKRDFSKAPIAQWHTRGLVFVVGIHTRVWRRY